MRPKIRRRCARSSAAAEHGLIAHRFYGSDGQILVIDGSPDERSFHDFFSDVGPQIHPMMDAAGVTAEPQALFRRKLEAHDDYG